MFPRLYLDYLRCRLLSSCWRKYSAFFFLGISFPDLLPNGPVGMTLEALQSSTSFLISLGLCQHPPLCAGSFHLHCSCVVSPVSWAQRAFPQASNEAQFFLTYPAPPRSMQKPCILVELPLQPADFDHFAYFSLIFLWTPPPLPF